ncbi:MAG: hypothetical protein K9G43_10545 [Rhodobacteraceae bacterium]|nr:hypothetical protein [Paracoccaceae bacterium]
MKGWRSIGPHPFIQNWRNAAYPLAIKALSENSDPLRSGGTWAVGLDLLPSAPDGSVAGVSLPWDVLGLAPVALHKAQLSTIYAGYPQPSADETPAGHRFRLQRDAAHLDGLLPIGPDKRRMVKEPHAWILGLPLTAPHAAPLVVWEGSHLVMQAALARAFAGHPPESLGDIDVTEVYQTARAEVFRSCPRLELPGHPGEAVVLHRHLIHGVAPWGDAPAVAEGRIVAYFRPIMPSVAAWMAPPTARDF